MSTILSSPSITDSSGRTTNAGLSQMAGHTYKGNNTASTANVADLTQAQLTAELNAFTTSLQGMVPAPVTSSGRFLRDDGTWATATGTTYSAGTGLTLTSTTFSLTTPVTAANGGTGVSSLAALTAALGLFTSSLQGLVNATGTPTGKFLRDDNTWQTIASGSAITALTGDGTATGPGSVGLTVTKTNGVAFAASATTDTTNASNITTGTLTLANALAGNGKQINNIATPTSQNDAATKDYVDRVTHYVNAASTSNLAATYSNGTAGVGATLTATSNAVFPNQDSFASVLNARYLIKNQASTFQNGIYVLTTLGTVSTPWVLTRATDYDEAFEIGNGETISVVAGTIARYQIFVQSALAPITVGTTALLFSNLQAIAGSGVSVSTSLGGQTISSLLSAAAFGVTPNANGLTVTAGASGAANTIAMQPADATHPGGILGTSAAQTLAPTFTFSQPPIMSGVNISSNTILTSALSSAATNATGSSIALRDGNSNTGFNEAYENLTTTVTSASQLTLSVSSSPLQILTGSTAQKVVLPDTTTTIVGKKFLIRNSSSALTSVYAADGTTLLVTVPANAERWFFITATSSANGTWSYTVATVSGTNTGDVTIGAFGSTPNANGLSISGQALTLQPASATQPGAIVGSGAQTLGATLTLNNTLAMNSQKITALATPTVATDAANKSYVDIEKSLNNWATVPMWQFPTGSNFTPFFLNNVFFIVMSAGAGLTASTDGITWTPVFPVGFFGSQTVKAIAYGASTFVAVGSAGGIATSPDGFTWTIRNSGVTTSFAGITFGAGVFTAPTVVNGVGVALTSADGITWSINPLKTGSTQLNAITFGASTFVAVGVTGTVFYSTTGTTWTQTDCKFGINAVSGVIFANSLFVAFGANGSLSTSTDGITWTARSPQFGASTITSVDFGLSLFVAVGGPYISTSPDGITWTRRLTNANTSLVRVRFLNSTTFIVGGIGGYIASSTDGSTWTSSTPDANYYANFGTTWTDFAVNGTGTYVAISFNSSIAASIISSTDAINWTARATVGGAGGSGAGVIWDSTNSIFVAWAAGNTTTLSTSPDGTTWTARSHNLTVGVTQVIFANSLFVAIGGTHVSTSPTGVTWTAATSVAVQPMFAIIYANSLYVAVGGTSGSAPDSMTAVTASSTWTTRQSQFIGTGLGVNFISSLQLVTFLNSLFIVTSSGGGGGGGIFTSSDGLTWTSRSVGGTNTFICGAFGASVWVLCGGVGIIYSSTDGITWTSRTSNFASNNINTVVFANSVFVAGSANGLLNSSPDGTTWTNRFTPTQTANGLSINTVVWTGTTFVAGGVKTSDYATTPLYSISSSPDGITWTNKANPQFGGNIQFLIYGASTVVAVGALNGGTLSYSLDNGATWTDTNNFQSSSSAGVLQTMAYNGSNMYVAAGTRGYAVSSPDGVTWTPRNVGVKPELVGFSASLNALQSVTAIAYGNSAFVAVGTTGFCSSSANGTTWTVRNAQFGNSSITGVIYANSLFVAYGANGLISTSSDGTTWTAQASGFDPSATINQLIFMNSLFVAVGTNGQLSTSTNGTTWTARTSQFGSNAINDVTFGLSLYVAVGTNGYISTSPDGTTWTLRPTPYNGSINHIAFGNSTFVTSNSTNAPSTLVSTNGTSWSGATSHIITAGTATDNLIFANGYFVFFRSSSMQTSTDGVTWLTRGFPLSATPTTGQVPFFINGFFWALSLGGNVAYRTLPT